MTVCDEDLLTGGMPHRCIIPEKKNRPLERSALRKFILVVRDYDDLTSSAV